MKYGISHLSTIPIRKEASDKSELVTQLLFGEHYKVIKSSEKWLLIEVGLDGYNGWLCKKQFFEISKSSYDKLKSTMFPAVAEIATAIQIMNNGAYPILFGSSLPAIKELQFDYKGEKFEIKKKITARKHLVENAYMYLNSSYLWGGRSPFGIDCSGFTQVVYKMNGIALPRDASQQAEDGDLAFFDNHEGKIIHVGIMLKKNQIIHASGKVRIDKIDHQGIFNQETNDYSHHLRLIKKII